MLTPPGPGLDVGVLLDRVEGTAPIEAGEAERRSQRCWARLNLRIEPPFGVVPAKAFQLQRFPPEPGDRIVLLTDGMRAQRRLPRRRGRSCRHGSSAPLEVVHELGAAVLHVTGGNLRDDAAIVCLDWHGGPPRRSPSGNGADTGTASSARPPNRRPA